ncbi:DNL zinc finger domain containing protein [Sclerotinia borealis F-4128]|uniref:DNL zinc finger domain containing protein n=1 Tax=Sclerotinia borealis (strain F-4128) TaxID=1432307 RepID=W9C417_SCLBF|nr:DNL zinc finger domain containing protein [Sclerotinia borealis F-4128]
MSIKSSTFAAFRALTRQTSRKTLPHISASSSSRPIPSPFSPLLITQLHPRHYSRARPLTDSPPFPSPITSAPRAPQPSYDITFTCTPCSERSTHRISKQGYHSGSVLITCPSCKNRHVISDHLGIFGDRKLTIEDLMEEQGMLVKKGTLSEDGNIEFWSDGTATERKKEGGEGEAAGGDGGIEGPMS